MTGLRIRVDRLLGGLARLQAGDAPVATIAGCHECLGVHPVRVVAELATLLIASGSSAEPDEDHLRVSVGFFCLLSAAGLA